MFIYRKEFGAERDIWTLKGRSNSGWEKTTYRELNFCIPHQIFSGDQIKKNEMCAQFARMREGRGAYRTSLGMSEGRIPL